MLAASRAQSDFGIVDVRAAERADEAAMYALGARNREIVPRLGSCRIRSGTRQPRSAIRGSSLARFRDSAARSAGGCRPFPTIGTGAGCSAGIRRQGRNAGVFSRSAAGARLEPLWKGGPANVSAGDNISEWHFERGRMIASSADFSSWVELARAWARTGRNPRVPQP